MTRHSTASTKAAWALLAALFVFNVYRAATCDITPAEAWNYDRYVSPSWADSLRHFDLHNHVLNTLLVRISTSILGRKEIALRFPSLIAGLLYYWVVWRLSARAFGRGWMCAGAVALLTCNPLVIDSGGEARGYGIALACWMWALDRILVYFEGDNPRCLNLAAVLLACSVGASLSFIVPVLGLAFTATLVARRGLGRELWLPLLVYLFLLLAIPMNRVLLSDLGQGATSMRQTLAELTAWSFGASGGIVAGIGRVVAAALLVVGAVAAIRKGREDRLLALLAGTAVSGVVMLLAAHAKWRAPFPEQGAIYFIPILTLLALLLCKRWSFPVMAGAAVCVIFYVAQLRPGYFLQGREFAGSRDAAKLIRADAGVKTAVIAASIELEPVMNYYRTRYRQGNWARIERKAPAPGAQYYVLAKVDAALVERYHLRILKTYPGMMVAVP